MENAIIYTRVSTDEQASQGYSLRSQKDVLERYCQINKINIVAHFQDDYSAKTFNRPEYNKLVEYAKKNKTKIDFLLIVRWDRFSRNVTDSLNMIKYFEKLGIEIKTVEQQIDLSNPENKLMLMFYLTIPEIENDRRSLNTRSGMIKAMKEGRWVSRAPIGYEMSRDEHNKPLLIPNEKAPLVRDIFKKFSKGNYTQEDLRKLYRKKGLILSRSYFNRLLINPVFIGKIKIPNCKDNNEEIYDGLHEPIVNEEVFQKVQDILTLSKKRGRKIKPLVEPLQLRGHLKCPQCDLKLTGSASKGNGGKYTITVKRAVRLDLEQIRLMVHSLLIYKT